MKGENAMYETIGGSDIGAAGALGAAMLIPMLIGLAVAIFLIAVQWKIFTKAGEAGWKAIVPFVNTWTFFKIAQGEGWKMFLTLIPVIGFVFPLIANVKLAHAFGKGTGFGIGLIILPYIFMPMLAFGNATYCGPQA